MTKLCTFLYDEYGDGFELNAQMVSQCVPLLLIRALFPDEALLALPLCQINDTLLLEEHASPARAQDRARQESDERQKRFMYHGYAFESYCTTTEPSNKHASSSSSSSSNGQSQSQSNGNASNGGGGSSGPSRWGGDVNTNEQWCKVIKTKLGDTRIVSIQAP